MFSQTNVLVDSDGTPHIAGLGSVPVHWQSPPIARPEDPHKPTRCSAPELVVPDAFGLPESQVTEASDIYALGVLAYQVRHPPDAHTLDSKRWSQVFAGNRMFHILADDAAVYLILNGLRPPRPNNPELSDRVWGMINRCWAHTPSRRIKIADAVSVLETELQQIR